MKFFLVGTGVVIAIFALLAWLAQASPSTFGCVVGAGALILGAIFLIAMAGNPLRH